MSEGIWVDEAGTLHEQCLLVFSPGGENVEFDPGARPELMYNRLGWAFVCPWCMEVWQRIAMLDHRRKQLPYQIYRVACVKHVDQYEVPGSVLAAGEGLLAILPEGQLRRELEVHLRSIEQPKGEQIGTEGAAVNGC